MLQRMREKVDMRLRHDRYVMLVAIRDVQLSVTAHENPEPHPDGDPRNVGLWSCMVDWLCKFLSLRRKKNQIVGQPAAAPARACTIRYYTTPAVAVRPTTHRGGVACISALCFDALSNMQTHVH